MKDIADDHCHAGYDIRMRQMVCECKAKNSRVADIVKCNPVALCTRTTTECNQNEFNNVVGWHWKNVAWDML